MTGTQKTPSAVVKIEDLTIQYHKSGLGQTKTTAVRNIRFEDQKSEIFGFLGPNGAGKTTTINVLLGFMSPTSGSASLFGIDVRQPIARQRIGYLPEMTYYYKFLTAEELLRFYAKIFKIPSAEADKRIANLLKLVELESASKHLIKTYSKGM